MEQRYERPREKLAHQGAAALESDELVQLVIGSGTGRYSSARIAREVTPLLVSVSATHQLLAAIPGVGLARASQLLAVQELAKRLRE